MLHNIRPVIRTAPAALAGKATLRIPTSPAPWAPKGRRLFIVDIENVLGGGAYTVADVEAVREHIELDFRLTDADQVVIGTSGPTNMLRAYDGWSRARHVAQMGHDGADNALLEVLEDEAIPTRFAEVILFSGDHAFADQVRVLEFCGCPTTVYSHQKRQSHELAAAASHCRRIPKNVYLAKSWTLAA